MSAYVTEIETTPSHRLKLNTSLVRAAIRNALSIEGTPEMETLTDIFLPLITQLLIHEKRSAKKLAKSLFELITQRRIELAIRLLEMIGELEITDPRHQKSEHSQLIPWRQLKYFAWETLIDLAGKETDIERKKVLNKLARKCLKPLDYPIPVTPEIDKSTSSA